MAAGSNMPPINIKISKLGDTCSIWNTSNNEIEDIDMSSKASIYRAESLSTNKKRKFNTNADMTNSRTFNQSEMQLQDILTHNAYSILSETDVTPIGNTKTNKGNKPPPIYIQAQVIELFIELLKQQAGNNNFTLKQLKDNQTKIQLSSSDYYRRIINALKSKNANFHTYQFKVDKSYKVILCRIHPKTNLQKIIDELKQHKHIVKTINNIVKYDTKQPLFAIELELNNNNKNIYSIEKLLQTLIKFEPPRPKREIPQ